MRNDNRSEDFTMSSEKNGGSPRQTRSRPNSKDAIEQNGEPTRENKVTATTVTSEGLGARQMTLYLSRTQSMLKPGSASQQRTDDNSEKKDSLPVQNGLSHVALQREFTFTGYDIMADNDPSEEEELEGEEKEKQGNVQSYISACRHLGHIPVSYIAKQINNTNLSMKCHPLGPEGARAISIALVTNRKVESLTLEDDAIGPDGAVHIADMLKENDTLTQIRIGENLIGTRGLYAFTELLKTGKPLHTLDISGSNLDDSDAKYIAQILETNSHLKVLIVRHNRISGTGGFSIGRAIAINETLSELDISWNHLRGKGALAVAVGVKRNVGLRKLNLAWNGFGQDGCLALGQAMKENRTLRELDIASNRLTVEAVAGLMKGIQENDGLTVLRMGQNPLSPEVALTILKAIDQSDKCIIHTLDLSDVVVTDDFLTAMMDMRQRRSIKVIYGATVRGKELAKTDPNSIDWRDPVVRMFKYMQETGYRVIDLMKRLDKDRSLSVDRNEFKKGLTAENIPLTDQQLDDIVSRLDTDGDGEVDLGELIAGEKDFRRRMHMRMRRQLKGQEKDRIDETLQKLMEIEEL